MELLMPKLQPEMLADREFVTRMMPRCFEMMRRINPDLMAKMRGMMTQDEDPATPRPESGRSEETRHPERGNNAYDVKARQAASYSFHHPVSTSMLVGRGSLPPPANLR